MSESEIFKPNRRGRPFEPGQSGNPAGKPPGTRNASTLLAEALLEGQAEALMETLIALALEGKMPALRLAVERLVPAHRERSLQFKLPPLETAADASAAMNSIAAGLAEGELTPSEAKALIGAVEAYLKIQNQIENDRRLTVLEEKIAEIQAENQVRKLTFVEGKP